MLSSCKNQFQEKKVKQIDSLQNIISGLHKKIISDTSLYMKVYNQIKSSTTIYKKYGIDIPADPQFRNRFVQFTQLDKDYKTLHKDLFVIFKEIDFSTKQLTDLKEDILNNAIKEQNKIDTFFRQESVHVTMIRNKVETMFANADIYKKSFDMLHIEMEAFAEKLKTTPVKK
jgi:hypothetical protein